MKKGAIFDMDGLMFDTERIYQEVWHELAREHSVTLDDSFARDICGTSGTHTDEVIRNHFHTGDPHQIRKDCSARIRRRLWDEVPKKPGISELLMFFKENGILTAVASSSPEDIIYRYLTTSGLREYIDQVISGEDLAHGKPAPDIFLKAADAIGLPACDCYVFEDAYNGIRAGHTAGAFTIMIPDVLPPNEEMENTADAICSSLLEVLEKVRAGEF